MSAPSASGCCRYGVANVLSTTTSAPCSWATAATASMSMHVSSGLVGVSSHTIAVSAGQSGGEGVDVGEVGGRPRHARAVPTPWRSAGTCRRRRRCRARPGRPAGPGAARCPRRRGRWRRPARGAPTRARRCTPRARCASGCPSASTRSPVAADAVLGERRRQRDRRDDGAGRRVGRLAGVDGAGVEAAATGGLRAHPRRHCHVDVVGDGLEVAEDVGAGDDGQRPAAGQHEQRRRRLEHLHRPLDLLADADRRQLRRPSPSRPACPSPTGRGRSPPSARARRPTPDTSAAANGGVFLHTGSWLTPLARISSIASRTVWSGLT